MVLHTIWQITKSTAKRDANTDAHSYCVLLYAAGLGEKIGRGTENMWGLILIEQYSQIV